MGSPVSAVVAMDFFEKMAIDLSTVKPKLWKRFVDDILCILRKGEEDLLLTHINSLRDSIKFTMGGWVNIFS